MSDYSFLQYIGAVTTVYRTMDKASIPLHQDNKDCQDFLAAWKSGEATVTNADGTPAPYSDAAVTALGLEPV